MGKLIGVAVFMLLIAMLLGFIGVARPSMIWNAAKIQTLVSRIGEGGARGVFIALAAINVAGAIFILVKARTAG